MRLLSRALRATLPAAVVITVLAAGSGTAGADERGPGLVARSKITLLVGFDSLKVCVHGERQVGTQITGEWQLDINGVRDGQYFTGTGWYSSGYTVDYCEYVQKFGTRDGTFVANFTFTGVGSNAVAQSIGHAVWNPAVGTQVASVDLSP
ncbi:MAG TPA: hypothetical protein VNA20_18085 [Frankiaceae bacterium]|nr:hypothetical protein [Frankiaceae bacterium]